MADCCKGCQCPVEDTCEEKESCCEDFVPVEECEKDGDEEVEKEND